MTHTSSKKKKESFTPTPIPLRKKSNLQNKTARLDQTPSALKAQTPSEKRSRACLDTGLEVEVLLDIRNSNPTTRPFLRDFIISLSLSISILIPLFRARIILKMRLLIRHLIHLSHCPQLVSLSILPFGGGGVSTV
jgi:hypothetical protein